jgi:hypothetical protein
MNGTQIFMIVMIEDDLKFEIFSAGLKKAFEISHTKFQLKKS